MWLGYHQHHPPHHHHHHVAFGRIWQLKWRFQRGPRESSNRKRSDHSYVHLQNTKMQKSKYDIENTKYKTQNTKHTNFQRKIQKSRKNQEKGKSCKYIVFSSNQNTSSWHIKVHLNTFDGRFK